MHPADFTHVNADDPGALVEVHEAIADDGRLVTIYRNITPLAHRHSPKPYAVTVTSPWGYDLGGGYAPSFTEAIEVAQRTLAGLPF